jgi:beta-fructofuranosidase
MSIFYKPEEGRCGDFIPFYWDGEYHLFYIHAVDSPMNHSWRHVGTRDFLDFTDYGIAIPCGGSKDQDRSIYTGCVVEAGGLFHIFYTGHNKDLAEQGPFQQVLMHATSRDLVSWQKDAHWRLEPMIELFGSVSWRDPFVFFNEEESRYWMLLTAHLKEGPPQRRGCTALLTSEDLVNWKAQEPIWAPMLFDAHECPDMFHVGDWWYLVFSQYRDAWITKYRMSKNPYGPWLVPADDAFDSPSFYAAKTASDGRRRFLFG